MIPYLSQQNLLRAMCLILANKLSKSLFYHRKCNPKMRTHIRIASVLCSSKSKHFWLFPKLDHFPIEKLFIGPCFAILIFVTFSLTLRYRPMPVAFLHFVNR